MASLNKLQQEQGLAPVLPSGVSEFCCTSVPSLVEKCLVYRQTPVYLRWWTQSQLPLAPHLPALLSSGACWFPSCQEAQLDSSCRDGSEQLMVFDSSPETIIPPKLLSREASSDVFRTLLRAGFPSVKALCCVFSP